MDRGERFPEYNQAAGQVDFSSPPPFTFPGVTMRIFPLRANVHKLGDFCDRYLNIVPPEVGVFRPWTGIVYFAMINYGKLGSAVSNAGWVAQNEVVFTVPLEWYRKDRKTGKLEFHDMASVTPFVFVDSMPSLTTGREVYGWPKVAAELEAEVDPWTKSPRRRRRVMALSTKLFGEVFAGRRQEPKMLIEIHQEAAPTFTETLPRWENPLNPFHAIPRVLRGAMTIAGDAMQLGARSPLQGYASPPDPQTVVGMARRALGNARPFALDLYNNTINLKQFRYADCPGEIAYQALTRSRMQFRRYNRGGLLGDHSLVRGSPDAGFRIRIHRHDEQPIIETLGLDLAGEYTKAGEPVAKLYPLMPCWFDLDMSYGRGDTLAWQTQELDWTSANGKPLQTKPCGPRNKTYNTTRGAAVQSISGPFRFPDTTVRVLPLLADPQCLTAFCSEYLCNTGELSFEAYGSYVYLVIQNYEEQASASMNVGRFRDKRVTFYIPMKVLKDKKLVSLGLVAPFSYANNGLEAVSEREINGYATVHADIDCPRGAWLDDAGPADEVRELMTVATNVVPALNLGQELEKRRLIHVRSGPLPLQDEEKWRQVAGDWGPRLWKDFETKFELAFGTPEGKGNVASRPPEATHFKNMRALALELLTPGENGCSFNEYSLKQFRDSFHAGRACYQSIVRNETFIERIHDMQEIEEPMHVGITDYPGHDIVKILGLAVKYRDVSGAYPVQWLEPQRPFWAKLSLRTRKPHELLYRAGPSKCWREFEGESLCPDDSGANGCYFEGSGLTGVGPSLVDEIDQQEMHLAQDLGWVPGQERRKPKPHFRDAWVSQTDSKHWPSAEIRRKRQHLKEARREWLAERKRTGARSEAAWREAVDVCREAAARAEAALRERDDKELRLAEADKQVGEAEAQAQTLREALATLRQDKKQGKKVSAADLTRLEGLARTLGRKAGNAKRRARRRRSDLGHARGRAAATQHAREQAEKDVRRTAPRLTREQAAEAVAAIHEPQAVIESILSREWGNWGASRWRRKADEAARLFASRDSGKALREAFERMKQNSSRLRSMPIDADQLESLVVKALDSPPTLQALMEVRGAQKPDFYIRSDSLGPGPEAKSFARDHRLVAKRVDEFYWHKARNHDEYTETLLSFLVAGDLIQSLELGWLELAADADQPECEEKPVEPG